MLYIYTFENHEEFLLKIFHAPGHSSVRRVLLPNWGSKMSTKWQSGGKNDSDLFSRQSPTQPTNVRRQSIAIPRPSWHSISLKKVEITHLNYCDEKFHPSDTPAIALSIGWYDNASGCLKHINVTANVTQLGVATKIMIMNLLLLTTLCLPQALYGKP